MINFIKKIFVYGLLILILSIVINFFIFSIPNNLYLAYESPLTTLSAKILRGERGNYDTLFIGASRTTRGIDPVYFDKLTKSTNSINVSVRGLTFPRYTAYLDYVFNNSKNVKNVFISIPFITNFFSDFKSNAEFYSLDIYDLNTVSSIVDIHHHYEIVDMHIQKLPFMFLTEITKKYLGFRMNQYVKKLLFSEHYDPLTENDYVKDQGFLTFEDQIILSSIQGRYDDLERLQKRRNEYLNGNISLDSFKHDYDYSSNRDYSYGEETRVTREFINVINKFIARGSNVYLFIPPRTSLRMQAEIYSQIKYLSDYTIIDFSNPYTYPELYERENGFDFAHLNAKGAKYFTEYFADEFNKLQN